MSKRFLSGLLSALIAFSGVVPAFAEDAEENIEEITEAVETVAEQTEEPYAYSLDGVGDVVSASSVAYSPAATLYKYFCQTNGVMSQTVYSAIIDPSRGGVVRGVSLGGRVGGRSAVTAMTNENEDERLLLAVNADFFSIATGVPLGVFMEDGRYVSSSDGLCAIGFDEDGRAFIGYVGDKVTFSHGNDDFTVEYFNKYPTVYGVYLLTRDFGETTYLADDVPSTEYIIEINKDIVFGKRVRGEVIEIRSGISNGEIPEGHAVLVVPNAYPYASQYKGIEVGDRVYIEAECDTLFEDAVSAVGGGDILLLDGEVPSDMPKESLQTARHPRTAVGITADGRIIMTVVDGRQSGYSNGLSLPSLAAALKAQGAVSALNFDGGGSSTFAVFTEEGGTLVNKPSDKVARKVPNALAAFADIETASELHMLYADIEHSLVLSGARLPISLTVTDYFDEVKDFVPTEENVRATVDERFGSVEISDGEVYFVAGGSDGYGNIRIEVDFEGETLFADIYLSVTSSIDGFSVDESLLLCETDGQMSFNVSVTKGDADVFIGDLLGVMCENESFFVDIDGKKVTLSLLPFEEETEVEETAETEETAESEETTEAEETTAVEEPAKPEETTEAAEETEEAETTKTSDVTEFAEPEETEDTRPLAAHGRVAVWLLDETVVIPAYFDNDLSLSLDEMIKDGISLSLDTHTLEYIEDGGVMGSGAFEIAPVPVETTEVTETSEVTETTDVTEETSAEEEEPVEPVGTVVSLNSDAIVSRGLSKRRIWLWADGLDPSANPYAVFKITDGEGSVREESVYYEMYYDFLDFSGRALLTLSCEFEEGERAELVSPFVYTAFDLEKRVVIGSFVLSNEFDTNLYADTADHWSNYYVNSLSYMGVVNGSVVDDETVFRPDDKLSREQFAKILVGYLKLDVEEFNDVSLDFEDSDEISDWAVPYVRAVIGASYMRGRETIRGTICFAPKDPITREEAFYVLGGLFDGDADKELSFTDGGEIAPWAEENLSRLVTLGLVGGYDDGTVRPKGNITRAEAATVVVKIADLAANS